MNARSFGYIVERLCNMLFQCESPKIEWRCPSLLSKWSILMDESPFTYR
jgi:hypothetical protein